MSHIDEVFDVLRAVIEEKNESVLAAMTREMQVRAAALDYASRTGHAKECRRFGCDCGYEKLVLLLGIGT